MKKLFKIPVLLFLLILSSCSEDELILQQQNALENKVESPDGRVPTECGIISISNVGNCPGVSETYSAESEEFTNPTYQWTVQSGDISITSSTTNQNVTVLYGPSYTGGSIKVVVTDANIICSTIEVLGACGGGGGCDITASINEVIPACYPSPNGKFSLTYSGNSSNVIWSVNNGNGTILSQSGKNEVIVRANNFSSFTLTATVTEGNCTETFTQVITPCNGCNITATIEEHIKPCYPSNHPHGRYALLYNGNSSNVTWSVDYGIILAQSGKYEVQVKPTTGLPFTLTATVIEGLCIQTFNMVIYPITDPLECEGNLEGPGGGFGGSGGF
ncbi:MAG: hypothetical protein JKY02_10305 [Flavobacteriaceae bacterium]|nr:hypothetical protein [Flavobacteriaceae bacterium]